MNRFLTYVFLVLILSGCGAGRFSSEYASGYSVSSPISCVPYARDASDFNLRGDAYTWWDQATGKGSRPQNGAVLVLAKTSRLSRGHVAVVTRVINSRQIDVTHSNWGSDRTSRSVVYEKMRVLDASPANDWSQVRFWNYKANCFGQPYPAYGFIYK